MKPEITRYVTRHYYELLNIAKTITKGHQLHKDLLQDVILQLMEKDVITLKSYDDNSIKYYITAVMRINWFSKTSPFFYRFKKKEGLTDELDITLIETIIDDQTVYEVDELMDIVEKEFSELDWFRKSLFEMYLCMGSYRSVSENTNIPLTSIAQYIKNSKNEIKEKVNNWKNNKDI